MIRAKLTRRSGVEMRVFGSVSAMFNYVNEVRNDLKKLSWRVIK